MTRTCSTTMRRTTRRCIESAVFALLLILLVVKLQEHWGNRRSNHRRSKSFDPLHYKRHGRKNTSFHHTTLPCSSVPLNKTGSSLPWESYRIGRIQLSRLVKPKMERSAHGNYIFIKNYAPANWNFECNESVTFTTHGGYEFLDNLVPIVERWEGPVSVAVYAPGSDFYEAVKRIHFLRDCTSNLVKSLVAFHLYFDKKFAGVTHVWSPTVLEEPYDCRSIPSFEDNPSSFRHLHNLTYPVNVGRNLARTSATTYFVLAADIELYPSLNIIPMFFEFMKAQSKQQKSKTVSPAVYVTPAFEVEESVLFPGTKRELVGLIQAKKAVSFHHKLCHYCHRLPRYELWLNSGHKTPKEVKVVFKGRRVDYYWEPVYIGTNQEPLWDERLTWEGQRNKMTQGYAMCLLDYRYNILDNAFLVHRPGIKTVQRFNIKKFKGEIWKNNVRIEKIRDELVAKYGNRSHCHL